MLRVRRCRVLTDGAWRRSSQSCAASRAVQCHLGRRPRQQSSTRPRHSSPARDAPLRRCGNARRQRRSPAERGHDRRGATSARNVLCRSSIGTPSSRFSMTARMTSSERAVAARTRARLLGRLGARARNEAPRDQCEHPSGRLDDPRKAGKIDAEGAGARGYCHGTPDVGFRDTYIAASGGAERSHLRPARPCRRRNPALGGPVVPKPRDGSAAGRLDTKNALNQ